MPIDFKVVTPYGVGYEDEVEKVTIPTTTGAITVHEAHAPLISVLEPGEMNIHKLDGNVVNMAVTGGFLEVRAQSRVYIMADTAERAEEIDIEQARKAIERAQELLKQQDQLADIDFAKLQAQIEREMARISVGRKYKNAK